MIDINLLRVSKGGNPELVKQSQLKRGGPEKAKLVDKVIELDADWINGSRKTLIINSSPIRS